MKIAKQIGTRRKTEIKMPEKTSINQKTTPASIESYTNILRRLNWRIVPKDTIIQIHAKLKNDTKRVRGVNRAFTTSTCC